MMHSPVFAVPPKAPTSLAVSVQGGKATLATFTSNLSTFTAVANAVSLTQTVTRNTTYYHRIRANNLGGSSAWANALPFPIRTGP